MLTVFGLKCGPPDSNELKVNVLATKLIRVLIEPLGEKKIVLCEDFSRSISIRHRR